MFSHIIQKVSASFPLMWLNIGLSRKITNTFYPHSSFIPKTGNYLKRVFCSYYVSLEYLQILIHIK